MRRPVMMALAAALLACAPGMAAADVREGVDAWSRGDYRKAVDEWRPAAIAGDADAQFNLGQAYTLGRGVPADIAMAESWFRKAALQDHPQAETKYGLVLFDEGKRGDAAPWLEKAVKRGEPRAQLVLGTMLFNGDGVARDWPRAYALLVRSAADTPRASAVQAQMDALIPAEQRQQGLLLARQYEAEAERPQLPPEIADQSAAPELPPSGYDPSVGTKPQAVAARGAWRVQLGAFADPANARKLWGQVGGRFPGATVSYSMTGKLTRVLAGSYTSKAAAAAACGSVRPCVAVGN